MWGWYEYDDYKIRKRNSEKEFQRRRASYAPGPMPDSRERDLEIPLEHPVPVRESQSRFKNHRKTAVIQQTKPQQKCLLLQKLPLDIRLMIWELCVGTELLHIVREPGRLGYIICPFWKLNLPFLSPTGAPPSEPTRSAIAEWAAPDNTSNHFCWSPQDTDGLSYARTGESKLFGLNNIGKRAFLPLLQTCRQIYTEALPALYQTNTFDLKSLDTLLTLPRTTIHVNLIRSLRISWNFCVDPLQPPTDANQRNGRHVLFSQAMPPFDLDTWLRACKFLSTMEGLQDLVFTIDGAGWVAQKPESASQLLLPLTGIKVGRRFEVHVPWEPNEWEDAVVGLVKKSGVRSKTKCENCGEKAACSDEAGWARRILMQSAASNAIGQRLTLDNWVSLLRNKEVEDGMAKKDMGFLGKKNDDDIKNITGKGEGRIRGRLSEELHAGKGKGKDKSDFENGADVRASAQRSEQKVGFEVVRREELLSVTKLPTFPARKKHRNRAFGRR